MKEMTIVQSLTVLSNCPEELYHIDQEYPTMTEKLEAFTSMGFQIRFEIKTGLGDFTMK